MRDTTASTIGSGETIEESYSTYWYEENKNLCDYLFVPVEDEGRSLRVLLDEGRETTRPA